MDYETGDGARIADYTAGLVIFGFATAVNYAVIGEVLLKREFNCHSYTP